MGKKIVFALIAFVVIMAVVVGTIALAVSLSKDEEQTTSAVSVSNEAETTAVYSSVLTEDTGIDTTSETTEETTEEITEETSDDPFDDLYENSIRCYISTESSDLNVREKPDEKSKKVGSVKKGSTIRVADSENYPSLYDEWVYIYYYEGDTGKTGWAKSEFITQYDALLEKSFEYKLDFSLHIYCEGKQQAKADKMIKQLLDFSQKHRDTFKMESYKYMGFNETEDGLAYIYLDYSDYVGSDAEAYRFFYVYPEKNKIVCYGYEWYWIIDLKDTQVSKIVFYTYGEEDKLWPES